MSDETIVLLHGFTGAPASWDPVIAHLPASAARRVIAPALLGHAGSAPHDARSWDEAIDALAAELASAGARGAHLVGYSMGGRAALGLLARHPALASRATLIGASPGIEDPDARAARRAEDESRARRLERDGLAAFVDAWEREPIFATQRALPDALRARQRAIRLSHSATGLAASLRAMGQGAMPSLWAALERLDVALTLVVGSEDAKLRAIAGRMAARARRARALVVAGAGHDVGLERPEALARVIADPSSPSAIAAEGHPPPAGGRGIGAP